MATSLQIFRRIADALDRLSPPPIDAAVFAEETLAYIWQGRALGLCGMDDIGYLPLSLIKAVDRQKKMLLDNTRNFASGYAANNVLLWGTRGAGKSSLVKSVCAEVYQTCPQLCLIEIARSELASLPELLRLIDDSTRRCIVFCDDLSFEPSDDEYKSLKSVLDGSLMNVTGRVVFYATSNRRHLMTREMSENEVQTVIHHGELRDERLSLTDRFGLWVGFHRINQEDYLAILESYAAYFQLNWSLENEDNRAEALQWSRERGGLSGRVAWQYISDVAGRQKRSLRISQ